MYEVKAVHWNKDRQRQEWYIAGVFDNWTNALIFRDAYKAHYSNKNVFVFGGSAPYITKDYEEV